MSCVSNRDLCAHYCEQQLWQRYPPQPPKQRPKSSSSIGSMINGLHASIHDNSNDDDDGKSKKKSKLVAAAEYSIHARQLVRYLSSLATHQRDTSRVLLQISSSTPLTLSQSLDTMVTNELDRILTACSTSTSISSTPTKSKSSTSST
jgi:hypothetical protein